MPVRLQTGLSEAGLAQLRAILRLPVLDGVPWSPRGDRQLASLQPAFAVMPWVRAAVPGPWLAVADGGMPDAVPQADPDVSQAAHEVLKIVGNPPPGARDGALQAWWLEVCLRVAGVLAARAQPSPVPERLGSDDIATAVGYCGLVAVGLNQLGRMEAWSGWTADPASARPAPAGGYDLAGKKWYAQAALWTSAVTRDCMDARVSVLDFAAVLAPRWLAGQDLAITPGQAIDAVAVMKTSAMVVAEVSEGDVLDFSMVSSGLTMLAPDGATLGRPGGQP